ncbi:CRISPR-associated endonuclease Cas2 [Oryzibacter oryziterrae]|uniref:CRISPR-associated endonuclease Cas2 n=1 Tax=Oryzibacter oryziterrae TaxID=2766474 RepID=UPI001EFF7695|nr:CRISPR-associated endonuclease Cas2 [Oryzibacter oryziterrae]
MSQTKVLAVFCYDVSKDHARNKLADLLETEAVRVQESVFEGWMSERRAHAIGEKAVRLIASDDSLRIYVLPLGSAMRTFTFGATPPVEADEFHLL